MIRNGQPGIAVPHGYGLWRSAAAGSGAGALRMAGGPRRPDTLLLAGGAMRSACGAMRVDGKILRATLRHARVLRPIATRRRNAGIADGCRLCLRQRRAKAHAQSEQQSGDDPLRHFDATPGELCIGSPARERRAGGTIRAAHRSSPFPRAARCARCRWGPDGLPATAKSAGPRPSTSSPAYCRSPRR